MICSEVLLSALITSQVATFGPSEKYKEATGIEPSQLEFSRKYVNEKIPGVAAVIVKGKLFLIKLRSEK